MPLPNIIDIARADLYTSREDLEAKYAITQVEDLIRNHSVPLHDLFCQRVNDGTT